MTRRTEKAEQAGIIKKQDGGCRPALYLSLLELSVRMIQVEIMKVVLALGAVFWYGHVVAILVRQICVIVCHAHHLGVFKGVWHRRSQYLLVHCAL